MERCIIEIEKNSDREAFIQIKLGPEWRIIHIPAELISRDIRKLELIIESCNTREK